MKKTLKKLSLVAAGLVACACGGIVAGCNNSTNKLNTTSEVYGFAALTTGAIMAEMTSGSPMAVAEPDFATQVVNKLDHYIDVFDSVVGGNSPVKISKQNVEEEYNSYANKIVVSTSNLLGGAQNYTMYFTERETVTLQQEIITDTDKNDVSSHLEGIIVLPNEAEINLYGVKTVEQDGEIEYEFQAYIDALNTHYVKFEYETEKTEQEYSFGFYQRGVNPGDQDILIEGFSFEMEVERGKVEIEMETSVGGQTTSFEVEEITKNGVRYLKISYQEPGQTEIEDILVTIDTTSDTPTYKYYIPNGEPIVK